MADFNCISNIEVLAFYNTFFAEHTVAKIFNFYLLLKFVKFEDLLRARVDDLYFLVLGKGLKLFLV